MRSPAGNFRHGPTMSSDAKRAATRASAARITSVTSDLRDSAARSRAVDPSHNVVLEASAGTGKTSVLVDRYVNLLLAGVDPENILAITFTRKAAAEMRQRIVQRVKEASRTSELDAKLW